MTDEHDLGAVAKAIIDANLYMVLGTADQTGRPWVSPVYYAPADYREFFCVSRPGANHSRNLEARGEVIIIIFDSSVPINSGPRRLHLGCSGRARRRTSARRDLDARDRRVLVTA